MAESIKTIQQQLLTLQNSSCRLSVYQKHKKDNGTVISLVSSSGNRELKLSGYFLGKMA